MRPDETRITRKRQLIHRIIDLNKVLGSDVTELFYDDYDINALEAELEYLEDLAEDEL